MMILWRRWLRLTTWAMARPRRTGVSDVIGSTLAVLRMPSVPNRRDRASPLLLPIGSPFLAQDAKLDHGRLLFHELDAGRQVDGRCQLIAARLASTSIDIDGTMIQLKRI